MELTSTPKPLTLADIAPRDKPLSSKEITALRRPTLDISQLTIDRGVPVVVQPHPWKTRKSEWVVLLQQLEIGDSVYVPGRTPNQIGYVRKIGTRLGIHLQIAADGHGARIGRVSPPASDQGALDLDDGLGN